MQSFTEENYLKAIYHLSAQKEGGLVNTSELAEATQTRSPTVTDMLKKLAEKDLIHYQKYQGVKLTETGNQIALKIIRSHRLWEVFLVEKLGFGWDEIHDIAEQLEHIESLDLVNRLDAYLNYPQFDPHGDPIPNAEGDMPEIRTIRLSQAPLSKPLVLTGVTEDSAVFLQHLDRLGLTIGTQLVISLQSDFDHSLTLHIDGQREIFITAAVATHLQVRLK
ncbi:MAG: metal-dependent transcriptional regulator [Spirosomataceae bacterium]